MYVEKAIDPWVLGVFLVLVVSILDCWMSTCVMENNLSALFFLVCNFFCFLKIGTTGEQFFYIKVIFFDSTGICCFGAVMDNSTITRTHTVQNDRGNAHGKTSFSLVLNALCVPFTPQNMTEVKVRYLQCNMATDVYYSGTKRKLVESKSNKIVEHVTLVFQSDHEDSFVVRTV